MRNRNGYTGRRSRRTRARLQGAALIGAIIAFGVALFPAFQWIDCYNYTKFANAYDACVADVNCDPSKRQEILYDRHAFKIYSCKED